MHIDLLCAGAAKGLVEALRPSFEERTGVTIRATFGAVGAMRERLDAGEPCDVLVLTQVQQEALARDRRIVAASMSPLGRVPTGIAVRKGDSLPAIGDGDGLRSALLAASRIYLPDPQRATAGIHFVRVLRDLGIHDAVAARLAPYPSGAVAMQALADTREAGAIGCTQVTEILYTAGVTLVGVLPAGFELATAYTAAVTAQAREPQWAQELVAALAGPGARALREKGGFVME